MDENQIIGIGLIGFGTVGSGVWNILMENQSLISARTEGLQFKIQKIAIRDLEKKRSPALPSSLFTSDWKEVVEDPNVSLVIELIGGTTTAFEIAQAALKHNKPFITGNKALLAERGAELYQQSTQTRTPLYFEAAVAGGIPIIKVLRESLVSNHIESLFGIINGTCNYILERMTHEGLTYQEALQEAMNLGYAEADPSLDVNGWDAAHKIIILGSLAYGFPIDHTQVYVRGIELVRPIDMSFAREMGYVIKLISTLKKHDNGSIEIRVQPSFIPEGHILAHVNGVFNAVWLKGDALGESLHYGKGAGQDPTATAVLSDLIQAAQDLKGAPEASSRPLARFPLPISPQGTLLEIDQTSTAYYVRFSVTDQLGVIAQIAKILAEQGIGISGTRSKVKASQPDADFTEIVFLLHSCPFGVLRSALKQISQLTCVTEEPVVFRIETPS